MGIEKILIITNTIKDPELTLTKDIADYLAAKDVHTKNILCNTDGDADIGEADLEGVSCVIVLGGDGTILKAQRAVAGRDLPLFGINLGTLGFLAEVEVEDVYEDLDRLLSGDFWIQDRMMLEAFVDHKVEAGEPPKQTFIQPALNEVSILRNGPIRIIRFSIWVNGEFLYRMNADGIVVATPTGSTGYNMSAGGPIVAPGARLILLTPICAHNLTARSVILSADDKIEIQLESTRGCETMSIAAASDGSECAHLLPGDKIVIKESSDTCKLIKLHRMSFVQKLQKKMNENK